MKLKALLVTAMAAALAQQAVAQTPKVTADPRFARGATMAFGRIKTVAANGGSAIQKRGFCLSENPEPTVDDTVSTKQLTNNGVIYYFENLKPATMYYMRAYATNKDGVTGYGDVIKFSTVPKGNITYWYNNGGDEAANKRVNDAATQACEIFNNLTSIQKHYSIGYSAGTPTADCYYADEPWMNMGANASYQRTGTIMHEMQHGLGLVPYSTQWNKNNLRERLDGDGRGSGHWLGDRVSAFLDFWDNTTGSQLNGDYQHMWPYGINGANEDNGSLALYYGNAMIGQALGEDGLEHRSATFADPCYILEQEDTVKYYLKCEAESRGLYNAYLKPNASGALKWVEMTTAEAARNDSAAWYITFTPSNQYYQLRNAATGQYMTYSGGIKTAQKTAPAASENWHLMRGRVDVGGQRGYWIVHPSGNWTPPCLQANASGNTGQATFNIANTAEVQRWLIMTIDQARQNETAAMAQLRGSVTAALARVKTLAGVPHTAAEGTDEALQATVSSIEQRLETAATTTELAALEAEALQAAADFLEAGVTPTDMAQPFDLTYMLANPTIDDGSDGWTGAPTINYGCGEFYQAAFDFNQTVKNLPAGTYAFCAQGFQRPGTTAASYSDYSKGTNRVNALIYAGNKTAKLAHICDTILSRKVGKGAESTLASGKYVPNDMQSASAYFAKGLYDNRVLGTVTTNGGSLKVGIRSASMPSNYWAIFDNFRLYFYGSAPADDVTPVKAVENRTQAAGGAVYDLQGRRVSQPSKGIYIINGQKVVVR